jgi:hypothetical protein
MYANLLSTLIVCDIQNILQHWLSLCYWQEYQKKVKHFFSLFLRQHSPCPDRTGFF